MSPTRLTRAAAAAAGSLLLAATGCHSDNHTHSGSDPSAGHTTSNPSHSGSPAGSHSNSPSVTSPSGSPAPSQSGTPTVETASPHSTSTGTGTPTASPTTSKPPADQPRGLNPSLPKHQLRRDNATDTALAFVITAETWDTRIDKRPNDAGRRAADLATDDLRHKMTTGEPKAAPGAEWEKLADHHGYTTVKTIPGGFGKPPPDTRTKAIRGVTVKKQTLHGDHHWTAHGSSSGSGYAFTLHRDHKGAPWSVADYTIE